jgi:hypothetical protein
MKATGDWRPLGAVNPTSLGEARQQAHFAVQWLARASRAYIPARPDDSHTNMGWNGSFDGFLTHPLPGGTRLGLSISTLTLTLFASDGERAAMALPGRTDAYTRAWLGEQVRLLKLDPAALDTPSPWEMPPHPLADGATYGGAALAIARTELAAWFANADRSLEGLRTRYADNASSVSPVRCWPHHFDLATLISLEGGDPEHARSVNAGLSPGDGSYGEPYFYVSPWPYPDTAKLAPPPAVGHWHTEGFLAAVAQGSRIVAIAAPQAAAEDFLEAAVTAAINKALG